MAVTVRRGTGSVKRSSRGKSPARANVGAAMTKRLGVQPSSGIGGSSHGTSSQRASVGRITAGADEHRAPGGNKAHREKRGW